MLNLVNISSLYSTACIYVEYISLGIFSAAGYDLSVILSQSTTNQSVFTVPTI